MRLAVTLNASAIDSAADIRATRGLRVGGGARQVRHCAEELVDQLAEPALARVQLQLDGSHALRLGHMGAQAAGLEEVALLDPTIGAAPDRLDPDAAVEAAAGEQDVALGETFHAGVGRVVRGGTDGRLVGRTGSRGRC